jgi:hypothetical protein
MVELPRTLSENSPKGYKKGQTSALIQVNMLWAVAIDDSFMTEERGIARVRSIREAR